MVILALLTCLCGCADNNDDRYAVHFPVEACFSPDPEVAMPAVKDAIDKHDGDRVLLTWALGSNADVRKMALKHFLTLETESPETFISRLDDLAHEIELRKEEVKEISRAIAQERKEHNESPESKR
jgi:uncharacterized protein Veg